METDKYSRMIVCCSTCQTKVWLIYVMKLGDGLKEIRNDEICWSQYSEALDTVNVIKIL